MIARVLTLLACLVPMAAFAQPVGFDPADYFKVLGTRHELQATLQVPFFFRDHNLPPPPDGFVAHAATTDSKLSLGGYLYGNTEYRVLMATDGWAQYSGLMTFGDAGATAWAQTHHQVGLELTMPDKASRAVVHADFSFDLEHSVASDWGLSPSRHFRLESWAYLASLDATASPDDNGYIQYSNPQVKFVRNERSLPFAEAEDHASFRMAIELNQDALLGIEYLSSAFNTWMLNREDWPIDVATELRMKLDKVGVTFYFDESGVAIAGGYDGPPAPTTEAFWMALSDGTVGWVAAPVPEPAAWMSLGAGLLAMGLLGRRNAKRAATA